MSETREPNIQEVCPFCTRPVSEHARQKIGENSYVLCASAPRDQITFAQSPLRNMEEPRLLNLSEIVDERTFQQKLDDATLNPPSTECGETMTGAYLHKLLDSFHKKLCASPDESTDPIHRRLLGLPNSVRQESKSVLIDGDGSWPAMEPIQDDIIFVSSLYGVQRIEPYPKSTVVNDTWVCDNHAPGSEISGIPLGEKCSVCGRSNSE